MASGDIINNYQILGEIGCGAFSKVMKGEYLLTSEKVAIKVINTKHFRENPKIYELMVNELQCLNQLKSWENVVELLDTFEKSGFLYVVYKYANGDTLEELLRKRKKFTEPEALEVIKPLFKTLKVLKSLNILHRDIKPANILYHNGVIKLADFGFCKLLREKSMTDSFVGSPLFMAPEILFGNSYCEKCDIWSMGIVYYQLLFGSFPFKESSVIKLVNFYQSSSSDIPIPFEISDHAKKLLRRTLVIDAKQRADIDEVVKILEDFPVEPSETRSVPSLCEKTKEGYAGNIEHMITNIKFSDSKATISKPIESTLPANIENPAEQIMENETKSSKNEKISDSLASVTTSSSLTRNRITYSTRLSNDSIPEQSASEQKGIDAELNELKVREKASIQDELVFQEIPSTSNINKSERIIAKEESKSLLFYITERNKSVFMSRVACEIVTNEVLSEANPGLALLIGYLILTNNKKFLRKEFDYKVDEMGPEANELMTIINEEILRVSKCLSLFEHELKEIRQSEHALEKISWLIDLDKFADEINKDQLDKIFLITTLLNFVEYLRESFGNLMKTTKDPKKSEEKFKTLLIMANDCLDIILIDELFQEFFEKDIKFDEKFYFSERNYRSSGILECFIDLKKVKAKNLLLSELRVPISEPPKNNIQLN